MYRKPRKVFPPGTFIPTPARVLAILQLCLAFACVLWYMGYPFMGAHFERKSQALKYEHVLADEARFAKLPLGEREKILSDFGALQTQNSFLTKLTEGMEIFFVRIPKFELIWVLLAVTLSLGVLRKREGAVMASWLLPLVALAFAVDNLSVSPNQPLTSEQRLFPTEKKIVEEYLKKPLSANVLTQREQLMQGWQLYLIREWAHEAPSTEPEVFARQFADGDFAFSVERLKRLTPIVNTFKEKRSPLVLLLYIVWNLIFAASITVINRPVSQQSTL